MPTKTQIRTIRVSNKGQISIPTEIRKSMKIKEGDDLVMLQKGDKIILEKSEKITLKLDDEFKDIDMITEQSLKELWDNKYDEAWDKYA
jgi:AbrB family looped-hinge helix DNA binding protein